MAIPAGMAMINQEARAYANKPAVIGAVDPGSPAEQAGIQRGDLIAKIDGQDNPTWTDVQDRILLNPGQGMQVTVKRDGETRQIDLQPSSLNYDQERIGDAGIRPVLGPTSKLFVDAVSRDAPAQEAGLKPGDQIVAFNAHPVEQNFAGRDQLVRGIQNSGGQP